MAIQFAPGSFAPGASTGSFLQGFGNSVNRGLEQVLQNQAEQQLYALNQQRQEENYKRQASALAPYLLATGQPVELADVLVRQPKFASDIIKNQQANALANAEVAASVAGGGGGYNPPNLQQILPSQPIQQQSPPGALAKVIQGAQPTSKAPTEQRQTPIENLAEKAQLKEAVKPSEPNITEGPPRFQASPKPEKFYDPNILNSLQPQAKQAYVKAVDKKYSQDLENWREDRKFGLEMQKSIDEREERKFNKGLKERSETREVQTEINKDTKELYDETVKEYGATKDSGNRLKRMDKLNNEGNLGYDTWNSILTKASDGIFGVGIDLSAWMTADAQEFRKLSQDFVKDAKPIFGSKLTDTDLINFMQTVPTLSQSKQGRQRVIDNLMIFNKGKQAKYEAMRQLIEENGGKRPDNLAIKLLDRTEEIKEQLAKQFINQQVGEVGPFAPTKITGQEYQDRQDFAKRLQDYYLANPAKTA